MPNDFDPVVLKNSKGATFTVYTPEQLVDSLSKGYTPFQDDGVANEQRVTAEMAIKQPESPRLYGHTKEGK